MQEGVLIKGIGGFYYVKTKDGGIIECRARGKFRIDDIVPTVGDVVRFETEDGVPGGYLLEILPRKNLLVRPSVANVDQFILVMSLKDPAPDLLLSDKLLIQAARRNVSAVIVLNKCDIADSAIYERVISEYCDWPAALLVTAAHTGEGLEELRTALRGKLSCFAGQSAVGKSSLLNALCADLALEVGDLSKKTARGKHTTRCSELLSLPGDAFVMDTPGFSLLDIDDIPGEELQQYYPPIADLAGQCRFENCVHRAEPGCVVKEALERGEIPKGRYDRYLLLLDELCEREKNKYR